MLSSTPGVTSKQKELGQKYSGRVCLQLLIFHYFSTLKTQQQPPPPTQELETAQQFCSHNKYLSLHTDIRNLRWTFLTGHFILT